MNPGPELDRRIAELIDDVDDHEWRYIATEGGFDGNECCEHYACFRCREEQEVEREADLPTGPCIRPFSTDWNNAMFAAEKAGLFKGSGDDSKTLLFQSDDGSVWHVAEYLPLHYAEWVINEPLATAPTGPHAICLAILKIKDTSNG